jgi:hypothetical protein
MTRQLIAIIAAALSLVACADYVPDADVQFSFEIAGDNELEMHAHAANAVAVLEPHLQYAVQARDPSITGVTWRSADQWRIVMRPVGYTITSPRGTKRVLGCSNDQPMGVTSYEQRTVFIAQCDSPSKRALLGAVVRHEIGHALGLTGHVHDRAAIMYERATNQHGPDSEYNEADIEAIARAQRHDFNTVIDALLVD